MATLQLDSDHAGIAALHASWMGAVAAGDADALRDLLTEDYEVWANAAVPIAGRDAAVLAMRPALSRFRIEQRFEAIETVIAGEWAFERGTEFMTATPITGGDTQSMTQRALVILRRGDDGRWRYARGMTNRFPA
jgi:uncharacterized protein (TIGR02246 family)